MTADALMKRMFEYSTSLNNCCAYVKDCVYTGKCLVDEDIVGCSQRNDFKKVKEALDAKFAKPGHWIYEGNPLAWTGWRCSECGCHGRGDYNYCPWCGVRMYELNGSEEE